MRFVIDHLQKRFENKQVLRDIHFTFESGRIYGLLGRNGAGKTTLFNCLNRDLAVDSGRFYLQTDGQERAVTPGDIGYVLSVPTVPEFLTGREFLKFFLEVNRDSLREQKPLDAYFEQIGIAPEDRDRLLKDYSHGMKNKMQMLVNLAAEPKLLLLDEPLTSLDVVAAEEMKHLLKERKADRVTLLSTHLLDLALDLCDSIVLLNNGVLEAVDPGLNGGAAFRNQILEALGGTGDDGA